MSKIVHMKKSKRRNEFDINKLIRIEICDLLTGTVAQSVERRRVKPWTSVRILACV